ncbi:MAG: hypothetical protein HHJ13_11875 [Phycicoccus sp.]|nr:hypothetical protein [Phycicoccus sp.]
MGISGKAGPSRAWFILPSLLLLAGLVLGGVAIASFVTLGGADFHDYPPGSSISLTKDGFTLSAADGVLGPDDLRDLRCTATRPDAQTSLRPSSGHTTLSNSRGTFVAIASTPTGFQPGRYAISCHTAAAGVDVPLYLGPRVDLAAVGGEAVFGIVAPLFLGICSVTLFAILAFLRYRARRIARETG